MDTPLSGAPDLLFKRLAEKAQEVFFAFDFQAGKILYLSPFFDVLWNKSSRELQSELSGFFDTIHPDDVQHVKDYFATLEPETVRKYVEFRLNTAPNEEEKWIKMSSYLVEMDNTLITAGVAMDFSDEKAYANNLLRFNDKKNSVLHLLSHDLLGFLGNIQLATELLSTDDKLGKDKAAMQLLGTITRSTKRSVNMIRDLLTNEFLESSSVALVKQRVDLAMMLSSITEEYLKDQFQLYQRFSFECNLDSLFVTIDTSKLMQAIQNLLSNAMKFTAKDGYIKLKLNRVDDKSVLIAIEDNGIGIPENLKPYIFDKFTQARRIGLRGESTNGLGMSIVKRIVEWHKGSIWFESEEGVGTTFYVKIPADNQGE